MAAQPNLSTCTLFYQQSGSSNAYWGTITPADAAFFTELLSTQVGCRNDDTLLECLRDIQAFDLVLDASAILFPATPVIDGATLLDHPLNLIESGQVQRKDVLILVCLSVCKKTLVICTSVGISFDIYCCTLH